MPSEVPEGWSLVRLGDVFQPKRQPIEVQADVLYTEIGVLSHGKGVFVKTPTTGAALGSKSVFQVVPDALVANIVFAWEGAIARTTREHSGLIASHRFPMWVPDSTRADLDYFAQYFRTSEGVLHAAQASPGGAGRNRTLNQTVFMNSRVMLPPLPEQKKIAAILSSVDEAIQATQAVIDQTRRVKEGVLQELLTRGMPGHTRFKQTEIGELPESWRIVTLDQMGSDRSSVLRTGPFGSSLKGEHFVATGRPVLNIQCLGIGELVGGHFFVSEEKAKELVDYEVVPGDIVFSRVADVGRSVVVPEYANRWIISSNLMRIRLDTTRFSPDFVMFQITNGPALLAQLSQNVNDAGRQIVSGAILRSIRFPAPSLPEQWAIVERASALDTVLRTSREHLRLLERHKAGLLQDLLTGRVRVSP